MKQILTALTIAASLMASGVSAFELNTTLSEENKMRGKPVVGDLSVGVKALLSYYNFACVKNGKVYLNSDITLETDPNKYQSHYEIIRQADGGFVATYVPAQEGGKDMPPFIRTKCDEVAEYYSESTFYPINSINGFTDRRSLLIDLINQGYE